MKMSEARLNDLVYLTLKYLFFEAEKMSPRECDIRVCMNMAVPGMNRSPMAAILLPDEVSPKSHDVFYDVDEEKVFNEIIQYMESHWMKASVDEVYGAGALVSMKQHFTEDIVPHVMSVPEEVCAVTLDKDGKPV